ncbi:hypothetical protein IscW_ISCW000543 [Ixodes scapularis]|uniref:Uncharacterized protein n=1 Tax=Ixodes scapularis TaxID=6945 RepID=B7P3R0_IXOSC|nr:hypothetical protein IscW_ISCW000543 [Ixodes scapularis]|eukprot:XP_002404569.1 hypothetical protein IscW_ISCW000543 [Ixodes scapularis]
MAHLSGLRCPELSQRWQIILSHSARKMECSTLEMFDGSCNFIYFGTFHKRGRRRKTARPSLESLRTLILHDGQRNAHAHCKGVQTTPAEVHPASASACAVFWLCVRGAKLCTCFARSISDNSLVMFSGV